VPRTHQVSNNMTDVMDWRVRKSMEATKSPSLTGRMSHSKPRPQYMLWPKQGEVSGVFANAKVGRSHFAGKTFSVTRRYLKVGELVEWSPTGKRGLWVVTNVNEVRDPSDLDYGTIERTLADPDLKAVYDKKYKRRVKHVKLPEGKVRLEWFSGWRGYEGKARPVMVKLEELSEPNEMETLGLSALDV